jgi:hypothetical protein
VGMDERNDSSFQEFGNHILGYTVSL